MQPVKYNEVEGSNNRLNDEGLEIDHWKTAEEKNIRESINLSYTERFRIMTTLMRVGNTLSRAKITHKKMPDHYGYNG